MNVTGERIRELRQKYNMTLDDVARHLGVGRQAIYKYAPPTENNTRQYLATLQTTGVPVDSKIASLKTDQFNRMVSMIETIEGWNKESKVTPF